MHSKRIDHNILTQIDEVKISRYIPSFTVLIITIIIFFIGCLFLPWIQTSQGIGTISTINPEDRLQPIIATISGRIDKWYVHDGSFVHKGDKIVALIDLDPENLKRIANDIEVNQNRISSLQVAVELSYKNYMRQKNLFQHGLTSQKDMEAAQIGYEKNRADLEYYKSSLIKLQSTQSKQQSQLITATRNGYVVSTIASSATNIVKPGDNLAFFIPKDIVPAAEVYVSGNDIPLIKPGQKVRLVFDGWPAVQFSGWPSVAIGTFGGVVKIVDYASSKNGMFRVLVEQDPTDLAWPENKFLRFGSKTEAFIRLNKVKLGYELWRQINGFPVSINQLDQPENGKK